MMSERAESISRLLWLCMPVVVAEADKFVVEKTHSGGKMLKCSSGNQDTFWFVLNEKGSDQGIEELSALLNGAVGKWHRYRQEPDDHTIQFSCVLGDGAEVVIDTGHDAVPEDPSIWVEKTVGEEKTTWQLMVHGIDELPA